MYAHDQMRHQSFGNNPTNKKTFTSYYAHIDTDLTPPLVDFCVNIQFNSIIFIRKY